MSTRRASDGIEEPLAPSPNPGPYLPLNSFAEEIRDQPLPSPPYRRVATASQVQLVAFQSPPYTSQSRLSLSEMNDDIRDEKSPLSGKVDETATATRAVHYPQNLSGRPPGLGALPRFESQTGSNTPSLAGTDDEDESDYDWSGEDDLAGEEEKFEKKMGVKQKQRGCGRYVAWIHFVIVNSCHSQDYDLSVFIVHWISVSGGDHGRRSHTRPVLLVQEESNRLSPLCAR
jgi:hypothetical protein